MYSAAVEWRLAMTQRCRESPHLTVVESGNGVNIRLDTCPMCLADLDDEQTASHIAGHSWADLMAAADQSRRDDAAGGRQPATVTP